METQELQVIIFNKDFDFARQLYNCTSELKNIKIMGVAKSSVELIFMLEKINIDLLIFNENPKTLYEFLYQFPTEVCSRIKSILNLDFSNDILMMKSISVFAERNTHENNFNEYGLFYNEILKFSETLYNISRRKENKIFNDCCVSQNHIATLLNDFGVSESLKGYSYLIDTIVLVSKENKLFKDINTLIYSEIAIRYNTTIIRVAKTIRHAIDVAWSKSDKLISGKYFNGELLSRPSDQEFICFLLKEYLTSRSEN